VSDCGCQSHPCTHELPGMAGPVEPIGFFALHVEDRTCLNCDADYTAHGARLECPNWAIKQKLERVK